MKFGMRLLAVTAALVLWVGTASAQSLNVATYNVRVNVESDAKRGDGWRERVPKICDVIKFYDFDLFGAQEVSYNQLNDMIKLLPGYSYIGVGRDDGVRAGEFSPVIYKEDKFKLLDSGNFWLSDDCTRPNLGWDAACIRVCSWGKFRIRGNGKVIWVFNTHFDHIGVVAREQSAKLIVAKIKEISGDGSNVILTGDFNSDQNSDVYYYLKSASGLRDTYDIADFKMEWSGTMNNFDPNIVTDYRIDFIFTGKDFLAKRYGILNDSYKSVDEAGEKNLPNFPKETKFKNARVRYPSDHFPVMSVLNF